MGIPSVCAYYLISTSMGFLPPQQCCLRTAGEVNANARAFLGKDRHAAQLKSLQPNAIMGARPKRAHPVQACPKQSTHNIGGCFLQNDIISLSPCITSVVQVLQHRCCAMCVSQPARIKLQRTVYLYTSRSELVSQALEDAQPAFQLSMVPGIDRHIPGPCGRRLPIQHVLCLLVRQLIL